MVDFLDDGFQAAGSSAAGLLADGFLEFIDALLARPAVAPLEVIPQKVKSPFLARIDNARFGRMQR